MKQLVICRLNAMLTAIQSVANRTEAPVVIWIALCIRFKFLEAEL